MIRHFRTQEARFRHFDHPRQATWQDVFLLVEKLDLGSGKGRCAPGSIGRRAIK
jgi:hypothetical protein